MQAISTSPMSLSMLRRFNTWYSVKDGSWNDPTIWISNGKRIHAVPQPGDNVYINTNVILDDPALSGKAYYINDVYIAGSLSCWATNAIALYIQGDLQATGKLDMSAGGRGHYLALSGVNNYVVNFVPGNSNVDYTRAGDQNVMPLIYWSVGIHNIGTKYLTGHTLLNGNLNVNEFQPYGAVLACGNYDLTVTGSSNITFGTGGSVIISKSGPGSILFIGACNINANPVFSSNVTSVEFRGGFTGGGVGQNIVFNCPVLFSTNSQVLGASNVVFNAPVTVAGEIVLDVTNIVTFNDTVQGTGAASTLTNNGNIMIGIPDEPMSETGIFNWMAGGNSSISYSCNGDFVIPHTVYNNLIIHGSGIKSLSGNTTVLNLSISAFQVPPDASLQCGIYDLTINGTATIQALSGGALLKSGAGTIIFAGAANWNSQNIAFPSGVVLEFRNGAILGVIAIPTNTIDATINFTTNNQSLSINGTQVFNGAINIADGLTLTLSSASADINSSPSFNGAINGSGSGAVLNVTAGLVLYNHADAPMITGKLYCNESLNTFVYGASGNQDIQVPSDPVPGYQNLTLTGSGVKRLLGNVSVKGTYQLVSSATLNLNGHSLTNP